MKRYMVLILSLSVYGMNFDPRLKQIIEYPSDYIHPHFDVVASRLATLKQQEGTLSLREAVEFDEYLDKRLVKMKRIRKGCLVTSALLGTATIMSWGYSLYNLLVFDLDKKVQMETILVPSFLTQFLLLQLIGGDGF